MQPFTDDFPMIPEVEAGAREPVLVAFGLYPHRDKQKSLEAGHDVFVDVEYVKIAIPGDKNSLYFQPATDKHRQRFPKAYAAFKARDQKPLEGMPIEQWAVVSRAVALTLKAAHIHTVEALAAVHDGLVDRIASNGRELREKARAWLEDARSGAAAQKLASEKKELQDQIASLQAQIAALQAGAGNKPAGPAPVVAEKEDTTADVGEDVVRAARRPRAKG